MTSRALVVPASVLVVLLSGCAGPAGDTGTSPEARAAEQVFVQEPVVVPDVSGTFATLRVRTDRDMACEVAFGRDGSTDDGAATDDDMGEGAHIDHAAVLRGLQPDTEYSYRVQGADADGVRYRSEVRTFRTPPADATSTPGENVAVGAEVVDASSEFSGAFAAANAVDGDLATEWSSAGDGDDSSLTIDLGRPVDVVGVALRSRSMSDGSSIVRTFTVTVDGGATYGPFDAGTTFTVNETAFTGQVLTIDAGDTTGGNTGAAEIEVYEAP